MKSKVGRFTFFTTLVIATSVLGQETRAPNVLVIYADQFRFDAMLDMNTRAFQRSYYLAQDGAPKAALWDGEKKGNGWLLRPDDGGTPTGTTTATNSQGLSTN